MQEKIKEYEGIIVGYDLMPTISRNGNFYCTIWVAIQNEKKRFYFIGSDEEELLEQIKYVECNQRIRIRSKNRLVVWASAEGGNGKPSWLFVLPSKQTQSKQPQPTSQQQQQQPTQQATQQQQDTNDALNLARRLQEKAQEGEFKRFSKTQIEELMGRLNSLLHLLQKEYISKVESDVFRKDDVDAFL